MKMPRDTAVHSDTTSELHSYITELGEYSAPYATVSNETLVELTKLFQRDGVKLRISDEDGFYKFSR